MSYISNYSGQDIDTTLSDARSFIDTAGGGVSELLLKIYPIGTIYMSLDYASPASRFGGVWEKIQDKFLLAEGTRAVGSAGGTESHTHASAAHSHTTQDHVLSVNEMPGHYHKSMMWGINTNQYFGVNSSGGSGKSKWQFSYTSNSSTQDNFYTQVIGGNAAHNHGNTGSTTPGNTGAASTLPPYLTVYMWKRTA